MEANEFQPSQKLLTKKDAAEYFSVSERTIDRWLLEGTLPEAARVNIGGTVRFRLSVLEDHISKLSRRRSG
ncbi:helix-turn-helix transcriptional regulator [Novipirellula artificiosorum]|uniref:Helix-turn-helix domain protein n=1 Tax=Novipirellula artificiosorum TaxID=2528016 RepID=A0A5C6DDG0_9BACT|nr:helix-turn-helix domain-containing protein [Novipirellula artificiosorum]TWU33807.1 Helix-turn-helix domain protein [Novipirellula artificiosorum]